MSRTLLSPVLVWLAGLAACGRVPLLDADTGGEAGASGGAAGDRNVPGAAGAPVDAGPASPRCEQGPASCNDNPAVSSIWGVCLSSGVCACKDGFSVNPATGRCRPANSCLAAASDAWTVSISFAFTSADCAMRPATPCAQSPGKTDDQRLAAEVLQFARSACGLPANAFLRLELLSGCTSVMSLRSADLGSFPNLVPCLKKELSNKRWTCAADAACVIVEWDTLP